MSFLRYSSACLVSGESILMLSFSSMKTTPYDLNSAPTQSIASLV